MTEVIQFPTGKVVPSPAVVVPPRAFLGTAKCAKCPPTMGNNEKEITLQFRAGKLKVTKLSCGHSFSEPCVPVTPTKTLEEYTWNGGKRLFSPFQVRTIQKTEEANLSFLNLNEMGLGKMVTSVATLYFHPEALPALVVCKARLTPQWMEHLVRMSTYVDENGKTGIKLIPQVLLGTHAVPFPSVFPVAIVSYDSLWRILNKSMLKNVSKAIAKKEELAEVNPDELPDKLLELIKESPFKEYKTIILDEFQMIKNPSAKRTQGVRLLCKNMRNRILCSGTPTKNSAAEYFVPLSIVDPEHFNSFRQFDDEYVDKYVTATGGVKALGIKPYRRKKFDSLIEPYSIRYLRKDVLPDLPLVFRKFEYVELSDQVKEHYKKELKDFDEAYDNWEAAQSAKDKFAAWGVVYESLMKLRRIVGTAKADWLVQPDGWLQEFLEGTDEKIVLAHHHVDAGIMLGGGCEVLCRNLGIKPPIQLHAGLSAEAGFAEINRFKENEDERILIIRQLAEGEGFNLQECGHMVQVERQWNPANEEQVEARLPRPGSKYEKVNVLYPVALGTMDEFLAALVERKRYAAENTYGKGAKVHWIQTDVLQDLAKELKAKGRNPWGGTR